MHSPILMVVAFGGWYTPVTRCIRAVVGRKRSDDWWSLRFTCPTAGGPGCPEHWASGFSGPGELRAIRSMTSWGSKPKPARLIQLRC
jgi:hypothetical protein